MQNKKHGENFDLGKFLMITHLGRTDSDQEQTKQRKP